MNESLKTLAEQIRGKHGRVKSLSLEMWTEAHDADLNPGLMQNFSRKRDQINAVLAEAAELLNKLYSADDELIKIKAQLELLLVKEKLKNLDEYQRQLDVLGGLIEGTVLEFPKR